MLTSPPVGPYVGSAEYLRLLPTYRFGGKDDVDIIAGLVSDLAVPQSFLVDCGAGPCRVGPKLPESVRRIVAVEPNRSLWVPQRRCDYVESDGFTYLLSTTDRPDVVLWLWSLNYPILAFFERYDPTVGEVHLLNWDEGDLIARRQVSAVFEKHSSAHHIILFFDDASPEQAFITSIWETVAPFPFHRRGHTRELLEFELSKLRDDGVLTFTKEHLLGQAIYGKTDLAFERMMTFHFKNHFGTDSKVIEDVQSFIRSHEMNGDVVIPAGAYLYMVSKS